jgi:hypothetical protein
MCPAKEILKKKTIVYLHNGLGYGCKGKHEEALCILDIEIS